MATFTDTIKSNKVAKAASPKEKFRRECRISREQMEADRLKRIETENRARGKAARDREKKEFDSATPNDAYVLDLSLLERQLDNRGEMGFVNVRTVMETIRKMDSNLRRRAK